MAEEYPSDSDLLSIISDVETGVEYIATGTAPYYLEFRKLLYRLLLASRRGNDLRVFDAGGLDIGVKSGRFWVGDTLVSYAGSAANALADDKAGIYVYLDSAGTLVVDEYTAFPDMQTAKHVRLAVVTTSGGDITAITDSRDHHSISMPSSGGGSMVIEAHTADDTLTEAESGSVHTNLGSTGIVTLTLPAGPEAGTRFTFCVQTAQQLRVEPGTAAIRDNSGQTAGRYKWADAVGECITIVADSNGDWAVTAKSGIWTEEV
ncbi:MAG: hypothetical protein KAR47_03795 [Planctomycetes bacterium]|nr:hypothetical protein [Planctomycetota bacterium]